MQFGTDTYRLGARERLREADLLLCNGHYAGSVYLAGLAVEGMLRSLIWLRDRSFDERHDLRRIAARVEELGLLRPGGRDSDFVATVEAVVVRWTNNLRFAGAVQVEQWLLAAHSGPKRMRMFPKLCREHYEQCSAVVSRCEVLWQRQRKSSLKRS